MKAGEVLRILQITRPTLCKYAKEGIIKSVLRPNGIRDYDADSVYKFLNKDLERKIYIYARVSTSKQKSDLENQINLLKNFCFQNGIRISGIFSDIAGGISFEKRDNFFQMLDEILAGKVKSVIITYKDRLSRVGFELFSRLFRKFGCEITVISEVGSEKLDSQEIFEEIVSMLHCYSMKMYSSRKNKVIQELISRE